MVGGTLCSDERGAGHFGFVDRHTAEVFSPRKGARRASHPPRRGTRTPPVSIVITPGNPVETDLGAAVESALAQDYAKLEVIVVGRFGGSELAALEQLESRHPRVLKVHPLAVPDQLTSVNRGIEFATGELVGFLAGDAVLMEGAVGALVGRLEADAGSVGAYSATWLIGANGEPVALRRPIAFDRSEAFRLHDRLVGPWSMVRADAVDALGGWNPRWRSCADLDFWIRVSAAGGVALVDQPMVAARLRTGEEGPCGGLEEARLRAEWAQDMIRESRDAEMLAVSAEAFHNACLVASQAIESRDVLHGRRFVLRDSLHEARLEPVGKPGGFAPARLVPGERVMP